MNKVEKIIIFFNKNKVKIYFLLCFLFFYFLIYIVNNGNDIINNDINNKKIKNENIDMNSIIQNKFIETQIKFNEYLIEKEKNLLYYLKSLDCNGSNVLGTGENIFIKCKIKDNEIFKNEFNYINNIYLKKEEEENKRKIFYFNDFYNVEFEFIGNDYVLLILTMESTISEKGIMELKNTIYNFKSVFYKNIKDKGYLHKEINNIINWLINEYNFKYDVQKNELYGMDNEYYFLNYNGISKNGKKIKIFDIGNISFMDEDFNGYIIYEGSMDDKINNIVYIDQIIKNNDFFGVILYNEKKVKFF